MKRSIIYLVALAIFASPFGSLLRAQTKPLHIVDVDGDALIFSQGVSLSYESQHDAAQQKFAEYRKRHPDDLLVYLRILYDRLFAKKDHQFSDEEYNEIFPMVSEAIAKYEAEEQAGNPCGETDIVSNAGNTLDCPYIGAALYSFRMTIQGQNDSWFKVGKDKNKFLATVKQSRSLQALFLSGFMEYKLSEQVWAYRQLIKWKAHLPVDHDHAVETILASVKGNTSPFRDDIYFAIFEIESTKGDEGLEERYSLPYVFGYLKNQYPNNRKIQEYEASKGGTF